MKKIILSALVLFSLGAAYAQLPEEDFEGAWSPVPASSGTSADWLTLENGVGLNFTWTQVEHANITPSYEETPGTHAAYLDKENVTNGTLAADYLVTPEFMVPENAQLRFYSRLTKPFDDGGIYKIKILADTSLDAADINNYIDLYTWPNELALNPIQLAYTEKVVPIPVPYSGTTVRIAFVMEGDNMDRWLIDKAKVVQECEIPTGLAAENITLTSAELTWNNPSGATQWEIEIIAEGSVPTGHGIIYSGQQPYVATATATGDPLVQQTFITDTAYRFYVRALCDDTGMSDWAGPFDFSTWGIGDTCNDPVQIGTLPYLTNDNTSNYGNAYQGTAGYLGCDTGPNTFDFFNGNEVVYQYTADFTGEIVIDFENTGIYAQAAFFVYNECGDIGINCMDAANSGVPSGPVNINSFPVTAGEDYFIVVTSTAGDVPTTPYTLIIQQQGCEEPGELPVSNIGTATATFSWTNLTGATSWELQVQEAGTGIPAGAGEYTVSASTGYAVNDLIASTNYEYYVRADCADGIFSTWAGPYLFSTKVCEDADQCLYTFVMTDTYGYGWAGQTMNVTQNGVVLAVLYGAPPGIGMAEIQISVCNDLPVEVFWNEGPMAYDYTSYIGLQILNSAEQVVYTMPTPPENFGFQGTMLYNTVADCNMLLCIPPTGLETSNVTMDSVDLSWNGPATGNWEYYIVESGQSAPTAATSGTIATANPALGISLAAPATNYDFYLRMLCEDNTYTAWAGPVSFGSSICPAEDKCDYVFTLGNIFGYGWSGGYMNILQDGVIAGTVGPSFYYGSTQSVTVSLCDDLPFEIDWVTAGTAAGGGGLFTLEVINSFGQTVFNMPSNSQNLVGTIIYSGENDCTYPLCIPPIDLYVDNITTTTADIGWEGLAFGSWEYYIAEEGQPAPDASTPGTVTTTNPTINVPLAIATNYEYYVRVVCPNNPGGFSEWAGPFAFNTEMCEEEEKCLYNFEILSLYGSGGSMGSSFTIVQNGNVAAEISMDFANPAYSQMIQVALCPDTDVTVYWNHPDGFTIDPGLAGWVGLNIYDPFYEHLYTMEFGSTLPTVEGTFLYTGATSCTPPPCQKPLNPEVTNITITSATLDWDEMGEAEQWTIWVVPYGSPEPVTGEGGVTVDEHPYTVTDLDSSSAYIFYVMAMCGDAGNSTVSFPVNFNTLITNDECAQAIPVPVNPGIECVESVSGVTSGATYSTPDELPNVACGNPPGYPDTWYSFVAENDTHVIGPIDYFDGYFIVYEGECGTLNQLFCNTTTASILLRDLTIGETYYIKVRYDAPFEICIRTPLAPVLAVSEIEDKQTAVEQMLMDPGCGVVSNVSIVSGSDFGYENSVGKFNQNGSGFPLEEGIVLATGGLDEVPGPAPGAHIHLTSADWPGDADLTAIFPDTSSFPSSNASVIEFDFVPSTCRIGFDFLFASDIYGTSWLCESNNGFAVLLTGPDNETVNLAVLPGTDTPISTQTVSSQDAITATGCEPQNAEYFGQMNLEDAINSPISYAGQTKMMYTSAQVLQGETYHIKIVIEDKDVHSVGCHDSALFIKGRACAEIVDLGIDLIEENGTAICYGETAVINTGLNPEEYDFTWSKDGVELVGETSETLTITGDAPFGEGNYTVFANYEGSNCGKEGSVDVEFYDEVQFTVSDLVVCEGGSGIIEVTPVNFDTAEATYSWTLDGEPFDGTASTIAVESAGVYEVAVSLHGCTVNDEAEVTLLPIPVADDLADVEACGSYTLPALTDGNTYYTASGGNGVQLNPGDIVTTNQTIFVYAQSATTPSCTSENSFTIAITPPLQFILGGPYIICPEEEALIAIGDANFDTTGADYTWTFNGAPLAATGSSITATEFGTYSVTVTAGNCSPVNQSVEVQENTLAITVLTEDFCEDNVFMLQAIDDEGSFDSLTATYLWTGPEGFTASTQQFDVPSRGLYTVVVTTPEGCVGTASTDILSTSCFIQRGISPNNDGDNDYFDLANLDVARLAIFNRYGMEVYTKNNYTNEWQGEANNGDELPTSTYFYMIECRDGEQITGWIYINREL